MIRKPHSFNLQWLAMLGYAASGLAGFWLVIEGFKYVDASIGGLIGLLEIPMSVVLGVIPGKLHDKSLEKNNRIRFAGRIAFGGRISRMFKYVLPTFRRSCPSCSFSMSIRSQHFLHAIALGVILFEDQIALSVILGGCVIIASAILPDIYALRHRGEKPIPPPPPL